MPIYEFNCEACGAEFERIQSFSDTSAPACPRCESRQVTRRMGRPAIHFKGSGWYITDSKKKSSGEGKSSSGTTGKSEGAAEKNGVDAQGEKAPTSDAAKNGAGEKSSEKKADTVKTAAAEKNAE